MFRYSWVLQNIQHFNLPVLYGVPSVGKTLVATCGAWLCGCQDTQIASRSTLSFLLQWLTTSTMPFIWDDPSNPEEVGQLAIDIGNGAVRGKSTEMPVTPLTACLVTANFDLASVARHNSRLCIIRMASVIGTKQPGVARLLESKAKDASAALPLLLKSVAEIDANQIYDATKNLTESVSFDIRVLEGIAVPLVTARKILASVGRDKYITDIEEYVANVMLPYVSEQMPTSDNCGNIIIKKLLEFPENIPNNVEIKDSTIRILRSHLIDIGIRETALSTLGKDAAKVVRLLGKARRASCIQMSTVEPYLLVDLQRALNPEEIEEDACHLEPVTTLEAREEAEPIQVVSSTHVPDTLPNDQASGKAPSPARAKRTRPRRHCKRTRSQQKLK